MKLFSILLAELLDLVLIFGILWEKPHPGFADAKSFNLLGKDRKSDIMIFAFWGSRENIWFPLVTKEKVRVRLFHCWKIEKKIFKKSKRGKRGKRIKGLSPPHHATNTKTNNIVATRIIVAAIRRATIPRIEVPRTTPQQMVIIIILIYPGSPIIWCSLIITMPIICTPFPCISYKPKPLGENSLLGLFLVDIPLLVLLRKYNCLHHN